MSWKACLRYTNEKEPFKNISIKDVDNYEALRKKIKEKFKVNEFTLTYIDAEKDQTAIEDDDDFNRIKAEQSLKIFINLPYQKINPSLATRKPDNDKKSMKKNKDKIKKQEAIPQQQNEQKDKIQQKWGQGQHQNLQKVQEKNEKQQQDEKQKARQQRIKQLPKWMQPRITQQVCTKKIPDPLMYKIGDKPVQGKNTLAGEDEEPYFICVICSTKYSDGPRYRCDTCEEYNVCQQCFKEDIHYSEQNKEHQMYYIQNRDLWQKYNFIHILQAFVDPYFYISERDTSKGFITQKQILTNSQTYIKQMNKYSGYYRRRLNKFSQRWLYRFQEIQEILAERKKKQEELQQKRLQALQQEQYKQYYFSSLLRYDSDENEDFY